jgi:hypothetical protein
MRFSTFICVLWASVAGAAGPSAGDAATAEALFAKGRRLVQSGRYDEACHVFDASYRLAATLGTLLNRGDCYEHTGRLADAWRAFDEAASWAAREQNNRRREAAFSRALALAGRVSWLEVKAEAGVKVSVDGDLLGAQGAGRRLPVDPGTHVVSAVAAVGGTWTREVEVPTRPRVMTVDVPSGAREPAPPAVDPEDSGSALEPLRVPLKHQQKQLSGARAQVMWVPGVHELTPGGF